MQDVLSSIPFMGMVATILLGIIAGIAACLFIISGIHLQRKQQVRKLPHPRIVAGILLLVFAIAQVVNELVSVYALHLGLSLYAVTFINILANASGILLLVIVPYVAIFQIRNRQ